MDMKQIETKLEVIVDSSITSSLQSLSPIQIITSNQTQSSSSTSILSRLHAGYFRISFSLCSQVLLWKTLGKPINDGHHHPLRHIVQMIPSEVFLFLWFTSLLTLAILSFLYTLRCFFYFNKVKAEFLHDVGVNYLFAPWISWLLLLESSPFALTKTIYYKVLWSVFTLPVIVLDVKIYGQWFTKGKRFLSTVANPASQLSVIGNLVGARVAAVIGLKETSLFLFALGMVHYFVLFVTLYQRFSGCDKLPAMLRPVFFLFFAAPSMASLAWYSISGTFDTPSKMLFFLSLFLFTSVVSRPTLFKRSMRKFNVAWWAYPFPLTVMALASAGYSQEVKNSFAHGLMIVLFVLSVVVTLGLLLLTVLNTKILFRMDDRVYDQK